MSDMEIKCYQDPIVFIQLKKTVLTDPQYFDGKALHKICYK